MTERAGSVYAVTTPGLEGLLAAECAAHSLQVVETEPGGVLLGPGDEVMYRANLELRIANRVLVRVAEFDARLFPELERHGKRLPWDRYVTRGSVVRFRVTSKKSRLYHEDAIAERLARSIERSVGAIDWGAGSESEDLGSGASQLGDSQMFVVRVFRDRFTISADSSGEILHRRGYREAGAKAPLRETLAAGMIAASGWDGTSWLADPFMGSGTIPIEAALVSRRIAPGLARRFAFERWPSFDAARWKAIQTAARARELPRATAPIFGYDRDAGAVAAARENAERAGVAADVELAVQPISALPTRETPGHIVTNPPYGTRIGDPRQLRNLYARLGQVSRVRCPGSVLTLLVAEPEHERALGLALRSAFRTSNGGIPVRCLSGATAPTR